MKPIIQKIGSTCWKWIFWAYERGSWQHTLLCAIIILILIFVPFWHGKETPQDNSSPVVVVEEKELDQELLYIKIELAPDQKPGADETKQLISALTEQLQKHHQVKNIIPLLSEDGKLRGFSLFVKK